MQKLESTKKKRQQIIKYSNKLKEREEKLIISILRVEVRRPKHSRHEGEQQLMPGTIYILIESA